MIFLFDFVEMQCGCYELSIVNSTTIVNIRLHKQNIADKASVYTHVNIYRHIDTYNSTLINETNVFIEREHVNKLIKEGPKLLCNAF